MKNSESVVPQHVGFIVDGNRRWARKRGLTVAEGHRQGYSNLKSVCIAALDQGVSYVSAYVFSTENWKRDKQEVSDLMKLLKWILVHEVKNFHKENIRLRVAGSRERVSPSLLKAIDEAEALTAQNDRGTLLLCLDYGGQQEIVDAVKQIAAASTPVGQITPELISQHLYAPDVPPVDLIIRTSGEQRLSNFMMWRSAYSELQFIDKFWPDFTAEDLVQSLELYAQKQRRFGV